MAWDAHKNFAISAVATAPSPATSGTSLVITAGQGTRFPAVPFNAVVWATGTSPDPTNAEVVRVTAISTDTFTITRAQESSSARTVVIGDQIADAITVKVITDIENTLGTGAAGSFADVTTRWAAQRWTVVNPAASSMVTLPGVAFMQSGTSLTLSLNRDYYFPFACGDYVTFDQLICNITGAAAGGNTGRVGLYNADTSWQPTGTLIEDFGTFATDSGGAKTVAPSGGSRILPGGRYVMAVNHSASVTYSGVAGSLLSGRANTALSLIGTTHVTRTYAAFLSTPTAWNAVGTGGGGLSYPFLMRVTAVG